MVELSEVKQRARTMWGSGDYAAISDLIAEMGTTTVDRVELREGEEALDVGCGDGNATIPAARTGARVTGLDLTPSLLEAGRAAAAEAGVQIEWVEGDAEQLPFDDTSFDVVISTVGSMFAPDHRAAAREIARVLRPGGRLGIASWAPDGGIGDFFKTVTGHLPPPPDGFQPPVLWGTEAHLRNLFEGTGVELEFEEHAVRFRFESAEAATSEYEQKFGPVVTAKATLEPEGRWEALRSDLIGLFTRLDDSSGDEGISFPGEYLLALGRKA
jgi:SAM-dependent methyltransferase